MRRKRAEIAVREANGIVNLRSELSTCIGSLHGSTVYAQELAGMELDNGGPRALAVGGYSEDTHILVREATLKVKLRNELGVDTYAKEDQIKIINGRNQFVVNGKEIERDRGRICVILRTKSEGLSPKNSMTRENKSGTVPVGSCPCNIEDPCGNKV